ncbi:MAG: hypothetical protein KDJ65_09850 [Anaerolineae bacterium]|nr:hypothetical protein [Anaerolineae bacterium]
MTAHAFLQSAAYVPCFASRPFLTAFVAALYATYFNSSTPVWFTHIITLIILGVLGVGEVLLRKDSDKPRS